MNPFKKLDESLENRVYAAQKAHAMSYLSEIRLIMNQFNLKNHRIHLSHGMGMTSATLYDTRDIWSKPDLDDYKNSDVYRAVEHIIGWLDHNIASILDGAVMNTNYVDDNEKILDTSSWQI